MMDKSIRPPLQNIWDNDLCAGCGACAAICPTGIITYGFDFRRGVYSAGVATSAKEHCTGCSLCAQVCPVGTQPSLDNRPLDTSLALAEWLIGPHENIYTGYAADNTLRYQCSSGGTATAVLLALMQTHQIDKAILPAPLPENGLRHGMTLVTEPQDIIRLSGSIYCPTDYAATWKYLQGGPARFGVVGLPCQIEALQSILALRGIDKTQVFTIGLFCGGTSRHSILPFLAQRKGIHPDRICSIRYRSGGWPGRRMLATIGSSRNASANRTAVLFDIEAGSQQRKLYNFCFSGPFFPRCCQICRDQTAEHADISLGDAWLARITAVDRVGTNIIISRTPRARQVIEDIVARGLITLQESGAEEVVVSQGSALVGRKLGLWGNHIRSQTCPAEARHACELFYPHFIPPAKVILERRFFNRLAETVPTPMAFGGYLYYQIFDGILHQIRNVLKRINHPRG